MSDTLADRILRRLDQQGLSKRALSVEVTGGRDPDLIRDVVRRGRKPEGDTLIRIAEALGTTPQWLARGGDEDDATREAEAARAKVRTEVSAANVDDLRLPFRPFEPEPARVPLVGSAVGGEYGEIEEHIELIELDLGEVLDWLPRTPDVAQDPDAYALNVLGDSMSPAFEPHTLVLVSPRSQVAIGDYVVVQLKGRTAEGADQEQVRMVLIKRLVRRSSAWVELRQFNPDATFRVEARRVAAIHKVVSARF